MTNSTTQTAKREQQTRIRGSSRQRMRNRRTKTAAVSIVKSNVRLDCSNLHIYHLQHLGHPMWPWSASRFLCGLFVLGVVLAALFILHHIPVAVCLHIAFFCISIFAVTRHHYRIITLVTAAAAAATASTLLQQLLRRRLLLHYHS